MNAIYAIPGESVSHSCQPRHAPKGALLMTNSKTNIDDVCKNNNDGTGSWVQSKESLKKVAQQKMNDTLDLGCDYKGVIYQCHLVDVDQFSRGLSLLELTGAQTIDCRAMDNSMHTLTSLEYKDLCITIGVVYKQALDTYWAEVDAIV